MTIWCVEDDAGVRDIEIYALNTAGFEARGFESGTEFLRSLETEKPDLVILDIMLPGIDGVELLKRLKATPDTCLLPVIMATAKGQEYDKVHSLDIGADDYLVKPFGMLEMVSRVKAVLRRCAAATAETLRAGGLQMNLAEHTVTADGVRVTLTYKEYELLRLLMSRPGAVFTRDQHFSSVWGSDYVGETRTLDMHIHTLRQKLGKYGELIETMSNVGYRMEAEK
ncbi:MAG: response regulator transcription factor [Oscillospiraceae bacterium]|nr:response regulator transcription factor [Oscillospiraceae bacterium]